MLEVDVDSLETQLPVLLDELLTGGGVLVIRDAFPEVDIAEARRLITHYSSTEDDKVTHFHGAHEDEVHLQRRVWNLLDKGEVFERMVQHPVVMRIVGAFLGDAFIMGSVAANRILPGGPGQEPHIDYPYWDLYRHGSFPIGINSSFPLNAQATVLLDDFTAENGATAYWPGSQKTLAYPDDDDGFNANAARQTGHAGDCVVFNGMVWHSAMPNHSDADRTAVLVEYLAKFVTPLEDQQRGVRQEVVDRASPMLRQLMGLDYPYPTLLDDVEAGVAYGRHTQELTRPVLGIAGLAAVMVLAGCGTADERGEPGEAVVAIGATGCRRTSTRAVGVVIADDLLATVAHAVAGESEIGVATTDGRQLRGVVAAIDTGLDAAIIRVDGLDVVPLARDEYHGDDEVTLWTAGDGVAHSEPVEIRRRATVRTTDIYRDGEHLRPGLELRADVEAGESGGGLVGADGDLLGLVWATSRERDDRAWAMPIEALDPLLAAAAAEDPVEAVRCAR